MIRTTWPYISICRFAFHKINRIFTLTKLNFIKHDKPNYLIRYLCNLLAVLGMYFWKLGDSFWEFKARPFITSKHATILNRNGKQTMENRIQIIGKGNFGDHHWSDILNVSHCQNSKEKCYQSTIKYIKTCDENGPSLSAGQS